MFSYNDGKLHDEVAVVSELELIKLSRVPNTTQYVASSAEIDKLRDAKVNYRYRVDNELSGVRMSSDDKRKPIKRTWESVPYIRVVPDAPADVLVYVIPGNPGLCEYYYELVAALARLIPGAEVAATSYLGYNVDTVVATEGIIGLDEQVEHKLRFLDFLLQDRSRKPSHIVVLGHSVGAWIAQRVAKRNKDVGFVGLLTPTVRNIALSERGALLTKGTRLLSPTHLYYSVWALRLLPFSDKFVANIVSRVFPQQEVGEEAREASSNLVRNPYVCYQILGMAIEEMERIGEEIEPKDIEGFWDSCRIWGCFAENDHWVSTETRNSLVDFAKCKNNVRMDIVPVPHAFCLRESETIAGLAAQQINQWIQPDSR